MERISIDTLESEDFLALSQQQVELCSQLARQGCHFSPCKFGYTHGWKGWNTNASRAGDKIKDWVEPGVTQLISVSRWGMFALLDIDNLSAAKEAGFDEAWVAGMLKVMTPGGGWHYYIPWSAGLEMLPRKACYTVLKDGKPIAELKLDDASCAAPWSIRHGVEGKQDGCYQPDTSQWKRNDKFLTSGLAYWFQQNCKQRPTPTVRGWEFHPDWDPDDFLAHNETSLADGDTEGFHEGSYDLVLESCPLCGKQARTDSSQTNFISKLKLGGSGYGFYCAACGVSTREGYEQEMRHIHPGWAPWPEYIYRHDDVELLFADGKKKGLEVEMMYPDDFPDEPVNEHAGPPVQAREEMVAKEEPVATVDVASVVATLTTSNEPEPSPAASLPVVASDVQPIDHTEVLATSLQIIGKGEDERTVKMAMTGILASHVVPERLEWLWEQRIPAGKITWLAGKPDCGKSLVLLDLVARITSGRDWPDGEKNTMGAKEVLLAASEDGIGDTVVPRLIAAGADLTKVLILKRIRPVDDEGVDKETGRQMELATDTLMLKRMLDTHPEIAMVGIDPITGYFGDADPNKDKEIRPVMESINRACAESKAAFVATVHHNKRSDVDALQKILGASSVAGVSRAAWGFSRDPEDKELLRMSRIKGNLSKKRTGLKYRIEDRTTDIRGKATKLPLIEWAGELDEDADQLMAQDKDKARNGEDMTALGKARVWLQWRLKDGEVLSKTLEQEAKDAGISRPSLWRFKGSPEGKEMIAAHEISHNAWAWRLRTTEGEMKALVEEARKEKQVQQDITTDIVSKPDEVI